MRIEEGYETIKKFSYFCDICGQATVTTSNCYICGRDICTSCTKFDPRDLGDYPPKYCKPCFDIGIKYLDLISMEQEKCDAIIEDLEEKWKEEAMNVIRK